MDVDAGSMGDDGHVQRVREIVADEQALRDLSCE
jgi:hypothetical protein